MKKLLSIITGIIVAIAYTSCGYEVDMPTFMITIIIITTVSGVCYLYDKR